MGNLWLTNSIKCTIIKKKKKKTRLTHQEGIAMGKQSINKSAFQSQEKPVRATGDPLLSFFKQEWTHSEISTSHGQSTDMKILSTEIRKQNQIR